MPKVYKTPWMTKDLDFHGIGKGDDFVCILCTRWANILWSISKNTKQVRLCFSDKPTNGTYKISAAVWGWLTIEGFRSPVMITNMLESMVRSQFPGFWGQSFDLYVWLEVK